MKYTGGRAWKIYQMYENGLPARGDLQAKLRRESLELLDPRGGLRREPATGIELALRNLAPKSRSIYRRTLL